MSSKLPAIDMKAGNVLLFLSKCASATRNITPPPGVQLTFGLTSCNKNTAKVLERAKELQKVAASRLEQAIRSSDHAARVRRSEIVKAKQPGIKKEKTRAKQRSRAR